MRENLLKVKNAIYKYSLIHYCLGLFNKSYSYIIHFRRLLLYFSPFRNFHQKLKFTKEFKNSSVQSKINKNF